MIKLSIETKRLEEIEDLSLRELERIFSPYELSCNNKITLAGKLAAKDAFIRNIGAPQLAENYTKIEIGKTLSGRPFVNIRDSSLSKEFSDCKISISISHTKKDAVAICILYDEKL